MTHWPLRCYTVLGFTFSKGFHGHPSVTSLMTLSKHDLEVLFILNTLFLKPYQEVQFFLRKQISLPASFSLLQVLECKHFLIGHFPPEVRMRVQIQKWEENFSNYVSDVLLFQPIHIDANRKLRRFLCSKNLLSSLRKMPDGHHACRELINTATGFQLCRSK